ncbi:hypothetical protein VTJ04DRAFT_8 [Mycothermus thermophilus]|uniref:uncharacterized protein n=1 Tax=Humicola insolens TaxID=85995 RepID=UPI003742535B
MFRNISFRLIPGQPGPTQQPPPASDAGSYTGNEIYRLPMRPRPTGNFTGFTLEDLKNDQGLLDEVLDVQAREARALVIWAQTADVFHTHVSDDYIDWMARNDSTTACRVWGCKRYGHDFADVNELRDHCVMAHEELANVAPKTSQSDRERIDRDNWIMATPKKFIIQPFVRFSQEAETLHQGRQQNPTAFGSGPGSWRGPDRITPQTWKSIIAAPILHILTVPTGSETGPTLFYIHGGGYVYPLRGPAHMPFILRCATACRARQVVILEYALAPEHPYPCQLVNAVTALSHLLQPTAPGLNLKPEDIVLAGDSAGGQLVGAILAHIAYPSPYTAPLKLHGQFRAALLVSPFVRLAPPGMSSYESNHGRDYLTKPQIDVFAAAWAAREDDIWANLCGVEEASKVWGQVFASGPTRLVRKVMVTVGTAEIFLECCRVFAREYVQAKTIAARKDMDFGVFEGMDAVLAECEGEVHVQPALDSVVGYDNGVMEQAIMSWLKGV